MAQVVTGRSEVDIAEHLSEAQLKWAQLAVGSYPRFEAERFHVIATIEGRDAEEVEACRAFISAALNPDPPMK
jgi:molybdopterin-biosynthesis enzyme MoeA-like protein